MQQITTKKITKTQKINHAVESAFFLFRSSKRNENEEKNDIRNCRRDQLTNSPQKRKKRKLCKYTNKKLKVSHTETQKK